MFRNLSTDGIGVSGRQSEVIELALSFGFKGIDLDLREFATQVQSSGLPHARRLLDSSKLKIGVFRLPLVWDEDDETYRKDVAALPNLLGLANQLGSKRCVTTVAPANDFRPYHENFAFHQRRLKEIADLLAPMDMKLGLEFVASPEARQGKAFQFLQDLDALAMLVGMVNAKNVGVVVDVWQMHVAGSSLDAVRKLTAARVVNVCLSDVADGEGEGNKTEKDRVLPGETGQIDSAAVLTAMAELGYDGPVTPRAHPSRFEGMRRDAIVKLAGEKLDVVWKAAGLNPAGKLAAAGSKK